MIEHRGALDGKGRRFALIASRYSPLIMNELVRGAQACLEQHGVEAERIELFWVPGSFEIPAAARAAAESGRFDAVVALGCIIKGATSHDQIIAREVASGLSRIAQETGIPCALGVITAETVEQALERAGVKSGGRGWEAALSALEMANLITALRAPRPRKK